MLSKGFIAGLLAVSLLMQGLPVSVCRCALGAAAKPEAANESVAKPVCPHCIAEAAEASKNAAEPANRDGEIAFAEPCCGHSSACPCCLEKSRSRTIVTTTDVSVPERSAPQALPPTDPLADLSGVSADGVVLGVPPDVPPRLPVRILLCVWRK